MKKLGDYKDEAAIELWADLLDPISEILQDKDIAKAYKSGANPVKMAQVISKKKPKATMDLLLRVDPTPVDGLNIVIRLVEVLMELQHTEELKGFFGSAGTVTESVSSGNATESTEGAEA